MDRFTNANNLPFVVAIQALALLLVAFFHVTATGKAVVAALRSPISWPRAQLNQVSPTSSTASRGDA